MFLLLLISSLDIIYTAGIGGEFMGCGCVGQEGGIARIATYIKETPHEILLDAGGIFGKSRFVDSLALVYLNDYGFDAVAVSPNELRFGPQFIAQMSKVAPLLCSNVFYLDRPVAREYLLKSCAGRKILITAVVDTALVKISQDDSVKVIDPDESITRIRSLPEVKDYDVHLNIINGRTRSISIEKMGSINANWIRKIGLVKIMDKKYENTTTVLDSTIPEDESTSKKIARVLNYLHNLPPREVITEFPARGTLNYYYNSDSDTLMNVFFPMLMREYAGMLGIRYIKITGEPFVMVDSTKVPVDNRLPVVLRQMINEKMGDGGDDKVQVVYFPNLNCPECQRYSLLLKAYGVENPDIKIAELEDEVLLQRFYDTYGIPQEKRQKPVIFIGTRYLLQCDISSENLFLDGKIPWLDIYGIE